jgi:hypothetical protein
MDTISAQDHMEEHALVKKKLHICLKQEYICGDDTCI